MKINCLDKGFVRLTRADGTDLDVVNSARVSFDRKVDELTDKDERLINYLAKHDHMSPFRQVSLQFEMYQPLMIARQHWKYVIGSSHQMDAWNESSRRYVTENEEFYIPSANEWRSYPDNVKQGSGESLSHDKGTELTRRLFEFIKDGEYLYQHAMELGVAPEQARLFLPAYGMYVRTMWKASLESVAHLIKQRTADDAQYEFRVYAGAIKEIAMDNFPVSLGALLKER